MTETDVTESAIKIAETGFGTGLNFLASLWYWSRIPGVKRKIHFLSIEKYPLDKTQLQKIHAHFKQKWPQLRVFCEALLQQYPDNISRTQEQVLEMTLLDGKINLTLLLNDASRGLQQLLPGHENSVDAWYLDGFAPAKNPQMWQPKLFHSIARLSKSGATLSTFTAAGFVRRGLVSEGFKMFKAPGFGKKRELLYGIYEVDRQGDES